MTINKVCGSGLKAVMLADQAIRAGDARLIVAGVLEPGLLGCGAGEGGELWCGTLKVPEHTGHRMTTPGAASRTMSTRRQ